MQTQSRAHFQSEEEAEKEEGQTWPASICGGWSCQLGSGCQQTLPHPLRTSWLQDWETASNDSVLTPQHGWPPAAGRGPEGCLAQSSMAMLAAAASAEDQQQRHGIRAAACLAARNASPAPEGGKQGLEGSSMPAPEAKRQKSRPTAPLKPVTRQHRLAPASQGICRVDLSATAAAAAHPDAAGSLALPAGLETPSREPAAASQSLKTGTAAAAQALAATAAPGASQQAASRRRKERPVFLHGNYSRYYGYRLGYAFDEDPRMQVRGPLQGCQLQLLLAAVTASCPGICDLHHPLCGCRSSNGPGSRGGAVWTLGATQAPSR